MKRSPLKRGTKPLVRRTPLRSRPEPSHLRDAKQAVRERSGGQCEANTPACTGRAVHVHHVLPRSAGGKHSTANLLHCCQHCHQFIHDHPALSYERGWLKRRTPAEPIDQPCDLCGHGASVHVLQWENDEAVSGDACQKCDCSDFKWRRNRAS